jgi:uncharacterized membrane protein YvlD (DUF360 family)
VKKILQEVFIYALAVYLTSQIFDGLVIKGGIQNLLILGALLALGFKLLKPLILTIALPLHILTLGLLSPIITVLTLFMLSKFLWFVQVSPFTFKGVTLFGLSIPGFSASILLSFIILSVTISVIAGVIRFVFSK